MSAEKTRSFWPLAATIVLLAAVFIPRPGNPGLWLHTLLEWLHVPVFGLVALALLLLMPRPWSATRRYGLALSGAIVLGVATEAIQIPMHRDASWEDIVSDAVGAAGFLLAVYAVGRKAVVATACLVGSMVILTWSAMPVISVTQAVVQRNSQFPVIFGGDIESERTFVSGRNVLMETRWARSRGQLYTRMEFIVARAPRIEIRDLFADWRSYSFLILDMEVEGEKDLEFTVRIHDKSHRRGNQPHDDRFNRRFALPPGHSQLRIPLQDVKNAPRGRSIDLSEIDGMIIFSGEADEARVFRLYEIRLD